MIVRTLFLKIFLWFWLALILVVATVILVVEPPRGERGRGGWPGGGPGFGMAGGEALNELQLKGLVAIYDVGGPNAFEQHRKDLEEAANLEVFVVDANDKEISGRQVPPTMLAAVRRRIEMPRRDPSERNQERGGEKPADRVVERTEEENASPREGDRPMRGGRAAGERNERGERGANRLLVAKHTTKAGEELVAFALERRRAGGGQPGMAEPLTALSNTDFLSINVLLRIAAILMVAGLVCWAMARYLTAPIRRLQSASRELESGDLAVRISSDLAGRHDEIGELARDFDRMARRVSTVISTQRQLLRDVSHELRSPLARLHVAVELASEDAPAQTNHALDRVRREADRLEELIGQLLALARLESGAVEQERIDVDLAETVKAIADDAQFEAAGKGRHVKLVTCDRCSTHGVPSLIRSAIDNVVRNAIDFTPENGTVEIALTASGDGTATVSVRDHGPGVPPDALSHIFEPFFRAVSSGSRGRTGTGLGLAITDRAVRLHRGTIEATNAEGGGLLMRITLPLQTSARTTN